MLVRVANFTNKGTTFPTGLIIGIRTYLPDVIIYIDLAAVGYAETQREKEDDSVTVTVAAVKLKKALRNDQMDR